VKTGKSFFFVGRQLDYFSFRHFRCQTPSGVTRLIHFSTLLKLVSSYPRTQTDGQTDGRTDRRTDGQPAWQANGRTFVRTDRWTCRQTY
jgi:hypothetical protein